MQRAHCTANVVVNGALTQTNVYASNIDSCAHRIAQAIEQVENE